MLTYVKYGNGKVGFVTTKYTITEDYKIKIKIRIAKEKESEVFETEEVSLTGEERKWIDNFRIALDSRKKPFLKEKEEKQEGTELLYNGESIEDVNLQQQIQLIINLLESHHEQISGDKIAPLYEKACQRLYQKRGC